METQQFVCIHCGSYLPSLYEKYGSSHIRLSVCHHCNNIADKYIEYDNVLLFLDLILIKPNAYRHTIYNVFMASGSDPCREMIQKRKPDKQETVPSTNALDGRSCNERSFSLLPLIFRLTILMILFEVYVTWAYQEKSFVDNPDQTSLIVSMVLRGPNQYIFFLTSTLLQNISLCLSLAYFGLKWLPFSEGTVLSSFVSKSQNTDFISAQSTISLAQIEDNSLKLQIPNTQINTYNEEKVLDPIIYSPKITFKRLFKIMAITTLISNIIKLFPIVMLIWPYDSPILHATRFFVRIVHIYLLIEAVHIVFIDTKNTRQKYNRRWAMIKGVPNTQFQSSSDYYRIAAIVILSELSTIVISNSIIAIIASLCCGVGISDIGKDYLKMFSVGVKMLKELMEYTLGEF